MEQCPVHIKELALECFLQVSTYHVRSCELM